MQGELLPMWGSGGGEQAKTKCNINIFCKNDKRQRKILS